MVGVPSASFRLRLIAMLIAIASIFTTSAAFAVEFKREENVGDLHLRIPLEYLAATTEHEAFLLAVYWPSMAPIDREGEGQPTFMSAAESTLTIGADEEHLTMSLDQRFETMRRFVGAGVAVGERYGLTFFPRDERLSRGHYDPHLELMAFSQGGHLQTIISCDAPRNMREPTCHGEFLFRNARITLNFAKPLLKDWRRMETSAQELLLSFADPAAP